MDRISDLPKEILQNILYSLSQQDAVRTSVLSKSWRYIWCTRPNLHLDFSYPNFQRNKQQFISVVNDTLQRYCDQGLCLKEFHLTISIMISRDDNLVSQLENWIRRLKHMGLKDFHLSVHWVPCIQRLIQQAPSVVFEAESLKRLHLRNCMLGLKSTPVKIASECLQELRLTRVKVEEEILDKIISSCPLLTTMWFEFCRGLKTVKFEKKLHKHLKHLTFLNHSTKNGCMIEIDVPTLETVNISCTEIQFRGNKFPNLKSLTLDSVLIYRNSSIETTPLTCDIDAPNISYFEYSGGFVPSISFTPTSGRSNIKLYLTSVVDGPPWILKLRELLQALRQSEISLDIVLRRGKITEINEEEIIAQGMINGDNKPVVVEHLKMSICLLFSSFLNSLFRICRPRNIYPYWIFFKTNWEWKEQSDCNLYNNLMRMVTRSGNRDLEDLRVECYDDTLLKWQPAQRATLLGCASSASKIRFRLKWSTNTCQSEF